MRMISKALMLSSIVLLHVGCMFGPYTPEGVREEIAAAAPLLPVAHVMPGTGQGEARIIVLKGTGSLFNTTPLLDEQWLHGKMTQAEYVQAISSIDDAVGQSMVGQSRTYSPDDVPEREDRKAAAATDRIAALNAIWQDRGVRFTFQRGREHQTRVSRRTSQRSTDTFIYLRIE